MSLPPVGYTPQYSFWPQYFTPPHALLAPARRASWMLIIVGTLLLLLGSLIALVAGLTDASAYVDMLEQAKRQNPNADTHMMTTGLMRGMFLTFGIVLAFLGLLIGIVGVCVRGGSAVAAVFGLVVIALPLLGILLLVAIAMAASPVDAVGFLLLMAIPIAVLITAAKFLFQVIGNAAKVEQSRQQLAMMQQHQMMAMQYGGGGYPPGYGGGYGYVPTQPMMPPTPHASPIPPPPPGDDAPTPPPAGG